MKAKVEPLVYKMKDFSSVARKLESDGGHSSVGDI